MGNNKGTNTLKGRPKSESHRRNMSEAAKRRWQDPDQRAHHSQIHRGKGHPHTEETRRRISQTRRDRLADGSIVISHLAGRGHGARVEEQWYRSSWEVIFASYCFIADIDFDYESIKLRHNGRIKIPDFLIDGVIYEVGWSDKSELREACEIAGYEFHQIWWEQIDLMSMFL